MRLEDVDGRFQVGRLGCEEEADPLSISVGTFGRWRRRYEEEGAEGRYDRRFGRVSARRACPPYDLGMRAPPNLGHDYGAEFAAIYPELAAKHRVALYPFFLDGVAAEPELNQADGIHPNARGVELIVGRIAPRVIQLLEGG